MTINSLTPSSNPLKSPLISEQSSSPRINGKTEAAPQIVSAQPLEATQKKTTDQQVKQAVEQIQGITKNLAQNLKFSIDEDTGITIIKVVDSQTQEVIRQMPTEEAVSIAQSLNKVQGLLFSDKA